jgi:hypothetical protein
MNDYPELYRQSTTFCVIRLALVVDYVDSSPTTSVLQSFNQVMVQKRMSDHLLTSQNVPGTIRSLRVAR